MLKLSDVCAPEWVWTSGSGSVHKMRPLSLETLAGAELMGCGLDQLLNTNQETAVQAWIFLYAYLAGITPDEALNEVTAYPGMFEAFVQHVQVTFQSPEEDPDHETSRGMNRRKSKDPRDKLKSLNSASMKADSDNPSSHTDYTVLFDLARLTKISLSDIYKMTFRGLLGLTKHIEKNPPVPAGLFGDGI